MSAPRPRMALLCLLGVAGCGSHAATGIDRGDGAVDEAPVPGGRRSFDVVATLATPAGGPLKGAPPQQAFTLVLDPDARQLIVGANGRAAVVAAETVDGRTFTTSQPFSVGVLGDVCNGLTSLDYTSLTLTLAGSSLHGKAQGMAQISCGDCQFAEPFVADVTGVPDATAPLLFSSGGVPANVLQGFSVVASEPLPATATAWLIASDGSHVDLMPTVVDGAVPLVTGFSKPDVVLPFGQGYVVAFDGLVDFAGLRGSSAAPLRLATFDTPPLLPEDGFESATGATVGGATVVTAAPLAPLAGGKSVYVGVSGAPSLPGVSPGAFLRVRLAITPGDTKLKFSYRSFSNFTGGFAGTVALGSVGHKPASVNTLPVNEPLAQVPWPNGAIVVTSPVSSEELALPADVGDELFVAFETGSSLCGPAQAPAGVVIDDLRLE